MSQRASAPLKPSNFSLQRGLYVVCAKADDPILRTARARLIWAANTAQATHNLGVKTVLAGGAFGLPYKVETLAGHHAVERQLSSLYGIAANFQLQLLFGNGNDKERLQWMIKQEYPRYVFPTAGLVHTRDPLIAVECARRGINYIWEHHGEDFQANFDTYADLKLDSNVCRAIVAITNSVASELRTRGVPNEKIIVLDSGVNASTALERLPSAQKWRKFLTGNGLYRGLVCYSGGLQKERGIEHIILAAKSLPHIRFVLLGGHENDIAIWTPELKSLALDNIKMLGYQPHSVVCEVQQASDILVLTRAADGRPNVTSPLKFFEYLLSGTPIVSAVIAALEPFVELGGDIKWYTPERPESLIDAIKSHFSSGRTWPCRSEHNIDLGRAYTWESRQRELLDFVGPVSPRTTY